MIELNPEPPARLKIIAGKLPPEAHGDFIELFALADEFERALNEAAAAKAKISSVEEVLLAVKGSSNCGLYAQSLERIAEVLDV